MAIPDKLLVIIPDKLSALVCKGEITPRYYNPGNLFREVHILMTNADRPDPADLQTTVGTAKLILHNLPKPSFIRTLGWQPPLIRDWVNRGLRLIGDIGPGLIRTHNNFLEGYLASRAKVARHIPYVVSLHGVWDRDNLRTPFERICRRLTQNYERIVLANADEVIAVYSSILRYARKYGARNPQLVYNVVAGDAIFRRRNYDCRDGEARLLTINRQLPEKNPENILRAIRDIPCRYILLGDGEYHPRLRRLATELGIQERVEFIKAMPNARVCTLLPTVDICVSHCDYFGMSKTIVEAALAGLPIVLNRHPVEPIPEYDGDWLCLCQNSPEGYRTALLKLLASAEARRQLGEKAWRHAKTTFDPAVMEGKTVALYRQAMERNGRGI
jgi:glycosyltransferase involved in cell wall biosynthesis